MNIYLELTREFNRGRLRAIISSGQAVVLHRLAIMSKDGDWILREDEETMNHLLEVLDRHQARYRFGAPLDVRWMAGGWSAHFEFRHETLRVRTDFVTRPPRLSAADLATLWSEQEQQKYPVVDIRRLVEIKKTNREKDYVVIGELARSLHQPREQLLYSRSAADLSALAAAHPDLVTELTPQRSLLAMIAQGRDPLEAALDAERRRLIHANEQRLARYTEGAQEWARLWPGVEREITKLPLPQAHRYIVERAQDVLPYVLSESKV